MQGLQSIDGAIHKAGGEEKVSFTQLRVIVNGAKINANLKTCFVNAIDTCNKK